MLRCLDLFFVGAQGTEQQAQVLHAPVVDASQALGDRLVTPGPGADCQVDRQQLAGEGERTRPPQPGPDVAALALDALEHLVGGLPLPGVEHLLQQCPSVGGMPVEASRGYADACARASTRTPSGPPAARARKPSSIHLLRGVRVMAAMSCEYHLRELTAP